MKKYPLAKPDIHASDILAVNQVLKSQHLSRGPVVKQFEQEFCQVIQCQYASAVSSGTAGLIMALQALNIKAGDEVITVSFTVPATVNCILAIGATPVMVDIEKESLGMCPLALNAAINKKTKAIIVVHAFGKSAKIKELISIAHNNNIKVIEDACEAIGNNLDNKPLGSFADIGVFGFYPNKQITSGEGGMLVTNNRDYYDAFELLKNHGRSMNGELYDQISFGWNFRLSDINAALGLSQLKRIESIVKKRQELASKYQVLLAGYHSVLCPVFSEKENGSAWFVYVVRLKKHDRDVVINQLIKHQIQCGRYFAPVHLQPYYQKKHPELSLKNTEEIASQCLALPFYLQLDEQDLNFICNNLLKYTI